MIVKLFTKPNCPICPLAKNVCTSLESEGVVVRRYDVETVDGMAEAALYEVEHTPTVIIVDDKDDEVKSWRGGAPKKEEVLTVLKQ